MARDEDLLVAKCDDGPTAKFRIGRCKLSNEHPL